jgi:hypothetical protein
MNDVGVLVPTIRAGSVQRVVDDLFATVDAAHVDLVFVCEMDDQVTRLAVADQMTADAAVKLILNENARNYAGAINTAIARTWYPYLFIGSDDLHFHPGWLPPLLEAAHEFGMVGTNDLHNPDVVAGRHATHYLVRRDYALTGCVDAPGKLLHEGYTHNYTDTEAVQTAMARGQYAHRADSIVEHLHPAWGLAQVDEGYRKSLTTAGDDAGRYAERMRLWTSL